MAMLLEKIVDERVGQTLVGTVSVAVDRIAVLQMVVATDDHRNAQRSDSNLPIG